VISGKQVTDKNQQRRNMKTGMVSLILSTLFLMIWSCGRNGVGNQNSELPEVGVALYSFNRFPFPETLEKSKQAGAKIVEGFFFHKLGGEFGEKRMPDLSD